MFEFLFVTWILLNGAVIGQVTIQTKTLDQCVVMNNSMIEDSLRIPSGSPIQTDVRPCFKATNTQL